MLMKIEFFIGFVVSKGCLSGSNAFVRDFKWVIYGVVEANHLYASGASQLVQI